MASLRHPNTALTKYTIEGKVKLDCIYSKTKN